MKKIALILLLLPKLIASEIEPIENEINSQSHSTENLEENDYNNLRTDTDKAPNYIWTDPLIIDANNHDFDTVSTFKLEANIIYKPKLKYSYPSPYTSYPAAIIIAKDNMTIDLNGFNLSFDKTSAPNFLTNSPTYGISVYQGVKNLKIISSSPMNQKGSISGFSDFAIYAKGLDQSYNSYDIYSNMIKNILIDNIFITQNINGIYIANALEATVSNTNIIYNYSARILHGIYFLNILEGMIDSCKINQNASFTNIYGVNLEDTINVTVENCQANMNRSSQTGNATGMLITVGSSSSYANRIANCQASGNLCSFVTGKKSIGFAINDVSRHNIIEKCRSFLCSHVTGSGSATTDGIGFQVDTAEHNQIHKNTSGYNDSYGFYDTAAISTSFWTSNIGLFNTTDNYNVTVPTSSGSTDLPATIVTPDDVTSYLAAGPILENISIELP